MFRRFVLTLFLASCALVSMAGNVMAELTDSDKTIISAMNISSSLKHAMMINGTSVTFDESGRLIRLSFACNSNVSTLPTDINTLTDLKALDLRYTAITTVPSALDNMPNLEELNLLGTKLSTGISTALQAKLKTIKMTIAPTAGTPTAGTPTAGTPTAGTPTAGTANAGTAPSVTISSIVNGLNGFTKAELVYIADSNLPMEKECADQSGIDAGIEKASALESAGMPLADIKAHLRKHSSYAYGYAKLTPEQVGSLSKEFNDYTIINEWEGVPPSASLGAAIMYVSDSQKVLPAVLVRLRTEDKSEECTWHSSEEKARILMKKKNAYINAKDELKDAQEALNSVKATKNRASADAFSKAERALKSAKESLDKVNNGVVKEAAAELTKANEAFESAKKSLDKVNNGEVKEAAAALTKAKEDFESAKESLDKVKDNDFDNKNTALATAQDKFNNAKKEYKNLERQFENHPIDWLWCFAKNSIRGADPTIGVTSATGNDGDTSSIILVGLAYPINRVGTINYGLSMATEGDIGDGDTLGGYFGVSLDTKLLKYLGY